MTSIYKMPNRKVFKSIVVAKFKSFCSHSTLHGLYYFYKTTNWFVHMVWLIIIALSVALCCFLGHMIWEKYVIDPTLTVVETTHYPIIKVEFPAVAVCDSEKVYLPNTEEITELLLLRGYNESQIMQFYKSFAAVTRTDYEPEGFVKKIHSLLEDLGYPQKLLLQMFRRPCSDMIMECSWRSRPYNCSDMFRPVYTIAGHCCQFDIPYFRQHTDAQTNYISGVESSEALDIAVTRPMERVDPDETNGYPMKAYSLRTASLSFVVDQNKHTENKADTFYETYVVIKLGHFQLYVFDRKDKITLVDGFTSLTPEAYFDVNVYTWAIDSSDNVKALPLASRKCTLETDEGTSATFYQDCMSRMILRRVADHCRCLPFDYTWMMQVDIKEIISDSNCYQRCDYVQYDNEVEFIKHQRHLNTLDERTSRVQVHFGQMTCMKYRREILYTWDQMLANLGGIFGLCLGGSIISVIEIVWFLVELVCALLASSCRRPTAVTLAPGHHQNKVHVLSHKDMASRKIADKIILNGKYKFVN